MKDTALITGASSGIGWELARLHAARGRDAILVAPAHTDVEERALRLQDAYGVHARAIHCDLTEPGAPEQLVQDATADGTEIDWLINNAGFGGHGFFHERDWATDRNMILLNVLAVTALARAVLPGMVARGRGHVLNLASVAAFLPGPRQAVYYATKAYVLSLSEALANELAGTGVTVTALCPGPTRTGFLDAAQVHEVRAFQRLAAPADVAEYGYRALEAGQAVAVPEFKYRLAVFALRFIPRSIAARISRATMEKV